MTQTEKKMKNYVNAVERRLNLPREIKARVMSDFQSSIVARREAGQTDEEIYAELGTPAKAAADLNEQMKDYTYRKSPWRFLFLGIAAIGGVRLLYDGFVSLIGYFILRRELVQSGGAAAIGIIGGADGPTAIFLTSKLAPDLLGAISISAYSYMALVPVIQPPVMRLFTTKKERLIHMKPPRQVSTTEKILFPIIGLLLTTFVVPSAIPLLGTLFFGNLLKECGVTKRLANTASGSMTDIVTILLGFTVGASTQATTFLTPKSLYIFIMGACAFFVASSCGVLFVKFFNLFLPKDAKINPLIGNAGVSAVPAAARVSQEMGLKYDKTNYLLMHAMGPNVAGVIGSAVAAGVLLAFLA